MVPFPIGSFVRIFLNQSKDDARRLIQHEMESMLDPLVESLFKQLKDKFVDYVGDSCPTVCFHQRHQENSGQLIHDSPTIVNHSLSNAHSKDANCQLNSSNHQPALMLIKEEINDPSMNVLFEPQQNHHSINSSSLTHEFIVPLTDESLPNTTMQPESQQPQQATHIRHNQFDDEYVCEKSVYGGIEVKEEDHEDEYDQMDDESSRPVKRPRIDTTQTHNAIYIMQKDDCQYGVSGQTIEVGQAMNTQFEHSQSTFPINSNLNCDETVPVHNLSVESPSCHDLMQQQEYNRMCTGTSTTSTNTSPTTHQHTYNIDLSQHLLVLNVPQHTHSITLNNEIDDEEESENVDDNEVDEFDRYEVANGLFDGEERLGSEDIRATIGQCSRDNSDESMVIQQEERDANNAIGEDSIATECTTNPIQPNLAQPNRHLQCSHCLKSFNCNYNLQRHLRMHTGESPFQCDNCGQRFNQKSNLESHKLVHQNIKRFRCPQCKKQFIRKDQLESHLLTHSGDRPYKCRHCDMSFTAPFTRNRHEQAIHLHVKPYRCKQCAHTAIQRAHVIKHVRVVHFGLPPTIKQQRALNIIDHRDPNEFVEKV